VRLKGRGFSHAERKSFSINPNDYERHIELLILYTELGRKAFFVFVSILNGDE